MHQMAATANVVPGRHQKLRSQSWSPKWIARTQWWKNHLGYLDMKPVSRVEPESESNMDCKFYKPCLSCCIKYLPMLSICMQLLFRIEMMPFYLCYCFYEAQGFSMWNLQTTAMGMTWKLYRNANFQRP